MGAGYCALYLVYTHAGNSSKSLASNAHTLMLKIMTLFFFINGGDINDNNFLLNITVDIKVVLFSLTHTGFILTCFVNF